MDAQIIYFQLYFEVRNYTTLKARFCEWNVKLKDDAIDQNSHYCCYGYVTTFKGLTKLNLLYCILLYTP